MSDGAFRDTSAAIERAAMLAVENAQLHDEIARLRKEVADLKVLVEQPANTSAVMKRLIEERDELSRRLIDANELAATRKAELDKLGSDAQSREAAARRFADQVGVFIDRLSDKFKK